MVETQQSKDTLWNGFPHIPMVRSILYGEEKVKAHLLDTSCTTKRTSAPPHDFSGPKDVNIAYVKERHAKKTHPTPPRCST